MPTDQPDWTESVLVGLAGFSAIGVANLKGIAKTLPINNSGITMVNRSTTLITIWNWGLASAPHTKSFLLAVDGTPSAYTADWIGPGNYASNRVAGLKAYGCSILLMTGTTSTYAYRLWLVYSVT
ncbi:MAG: hypothetical protein ACYCSJ_01485 [Acidimicrobiales bacterium]